jgi:hypothetical protein
MARAFIFEGNQPTRRVGCLQKEHSPDLPYKRTVSSHSYHGHYRICIRHGQKPCNILAPFVGVDDGQCKGNILKRREQREEQKIKHVGHSRAHVLK